MTITKIFRLLVFAVPLWPALSLAVDRIWLEAKINNKPVQLAFDSASSWPILTPSAVERLGIRVAAAPTNNIGLHVMGGRTEEVAFNLEGTESKVSFLIISEPSYGALDCDGALSWSCISRSVLRIDAETGQLEFLENAPRSTSGWTCVSVATNLGVLGLQMPISGDRNGIVLVDTGSFDGVELPPREWQRWRQAHPSTPITLETGFTPHEGLYVFEEAWADQISIGPIILSGVPIAQSGQGIADRIGGHYEGILGIAALKRLDLIVDGKTGSAFLRPKHIPPPEYEHNRLGAVFVPSAGHTNQEVARVVENGPAYEAGVRNGDILLQVDEVKVTSWNNRWISRFQKPAGTKLKLTLQRGARDFVTAATLRDIVRPSR